jgi:hypothetical protein
MHEVEAWQRECGTNFCENVRESTKLVEALFLRVVTALSDKRKAKDRVFTYGLKRRVQTHQSSQNFTILIPLPPYTRNNTPDMHTTCKRRVSPGIEPGTTRNIDLEFSRTLLGDLPKRVSYR